MQGQPQQPQQFRQAQPQQYRQAQPQQVRTMAPQAQQVYRQQQPQVVRTVPQNIRNTHANGDERRLDEHSARILASKVFNKYDANHSGYMNSQEAGQLVSDLYSSLNVNHAPNQQEGLEFMVANDVNSDHQISLQDFQDIFVRNLSAGMGGYRLFTDDNTYATGVIGGVHEPAQRVVQAPVRTYAGQQPVRTQVSGQQRVVMGGQQPVRR